MLTLPANEVYKDGKRKETLVTYLVGNCLQDRVEVDIDSRGLDLGSAEVFEVLDRFEVQATAEVRV